MSLLDVLGDLADLFLTRRMAAGIVLGALVAVAAHAALDDPLGTRVALLAVVAGIVGGIAWEYRRRHEY